MPTQKRETGKNYIGLLRDQGEDESAIELPSVTGRRVKDYFRGLMAVMLKRRRGEIR